MNNLNQSSHKMKVAIADFLTVATVVTPQNQLLRAQSAEMPTKTNSNTTSSNEKFLSADLEKKDSKKSFFHEATNQRCTAFLGNNSAIKGWRTPKGERRKLPSIDQFVTKQTVSFNFF